MALLYHNNNYYCFIDAFLHYFTDARIPAATPGNSLSFMRDDRVSGTGVPGRLRPDDAKMHPPQKGNREKNFFRCKNASFCLEKEKCEKNNQKNQLNTKMARPVL